MNRFLVAILAVHLLGCKDSSTQPTKTASQLTKADIAMERFEAEWWTEDQIRRVYIGARRCESNNNEPPLDIVLWSVRPILSTNGSNCIDIEVTPSNAPSHIPAQPAILTLWRTGDRLTIECGEMPNHPMTGKYRYSSKLAPSKGPGIHEWGLQ